MIQVDLERARSFLSHKEYRQCLLKAEKAFQKVQQQNGAGAEWLGWRGLLADPKDAILEQMDSLAAAIRQKADMFIVCGIGGSYLGARAVIDALSSLFGHSGPEICYAGHHMSGKYLKELITHLEAPNSDGDPKSVYLNVISKSGTTLETALSFRVLRRWMQERYENLKLLFTTGFKHRRLRQL